MTFTYDRERKVWRSKCGNYKVWLQARPRDDSPHWAAQYQDEEWLTACADGKADAIRVCREHAAGTFRRI